MTYLEGDTEMRGKTGMSQNMDEIAGDLAYARLAARSLAHADHGSDAYHKAVGRLLVAFNALDGHAVFHKIDEHTGYEAPDEMLARIRVQNLPRRGPAEWGDQPGYGGGDRIDFSSSHFEGPVAGETVTNESPRR